MVRFARLIIAGFLASATAASAETVGFSQIGAESAWRVAFSADMKAVAKS
jgi:galactofuranose transport system substrate-binding protein